MRSPDLRRELQDVAIERNRNFIKCYGQRDPAGIVSNVADRALALPPNGELIDGKSALEDYWRQSFDAGLHEFRLETVTIEGNDELAYHVGKFWVDHVAPDGTARTRPGTFVEVLRREPDGSWKLYVDAWNFDSET